MGVMKRLKQQGRDAGKSARAIRSSKRHTSQTGLIDISMEEAEFMANLKSMERLHKSITPRWIKSTQRRHLKPMVNAMKAGSKSTRIAAMIGVTTAKKRAGKYGAKVGVIKNDKSRFPDFSAPALASLIEYGSEGERFRQLKAGILVTGRQSTGTMPAVPWLRPAWDAHSGAFMDKVEDSIQKKIMSEV